MTSKVTLGTTSDDSCRESMENNVSAVYSAPIGTGKFTLELIAKKVSVLSL